jgi:hypothetical protein
MPYSERRDLVPDGIETYGFSWGDWQGTAVSFKCLKHGFDEGHMSIDFADLAISSEMRNTAADFLRRANLSARDDDTLVPKWRVLYEFS